jgi:hypothetical protein
MEEWVPLQDFPGYSISSEGRVRNDRFDRLRKINYHGGYATVAFYKNRRTVNRTLAHLVAREFVSRPRDTFDTPIYLDGDKRNCKATNIMWRPRWFAIRHEVQFRLDVWPLVFDRGVIFNDVVLSIANCTYVFPLYQNFEWVI